MVCWVRVRVRVRVRVNPNPNPNPNRNPNPNPNPNPNLTFVPETRVGRSKLNQMRKYFDKVIAEEMNHILRLIVYRASTTGNI